MAIALEMSAYDPKADITAYGDCNLNQGARTLQYGFPLISCYAIEKDNSGDGTIGFVG
jgi:hypothetical protein